MRIRYLFLLLLAVTWNAQVKASEAPYVNEIKGNQVYVSQTLTVSDDKLTPAANALISSYTSIYNIVSFEIDLGSQQYFFNQPFTATLDYTLIKYKNDQPDQVLDSSYQTLTVEFKNDGSNYKGVAYYKFTGSRKFMIRVRNVSSPQMNPIKQIFRVKSQILIDRKFLFDPVSPDTMRFEKMGNQMRVTWKPYHYKGAEEFDFEYTYIDKASEVATRLNWQQGQLYSLSSDTLSKWFENNASRVVTDSSGHTINLINAEGFVLFRIRHVYYTKDENVRVEGEWNYRSMEQSGLGIGSGLVYFDWHEPMLNWQYSVSFAEQGKKKEVVSYFDGTLKSRQMVTINNTDNVSVVQESVYDRLGRAALQVLPAPTDDNTLHYFPAFTRNASNNPYSYLDIGDGVNCGSLVGAMSASSGSARYYSPQNSFIATYNIAKHIPDAEGYPFTATEFTTDNTGRVKKQGGVGPLFQLNGGKETKYYYGKPSQTELDRLFGSEAGDASHYLKNMVVDPNGQVSVSYVNASGKTIATALAGSSPANLDALPANNGTANVPYTNDIFRSRDMSLGANGTSLSATSSFVAPLPGPYTINYNVLPEKMIKVFGLNKDSTICSTCYYDMSIRVANDCGEIVYSQVVPSVQIYDSTCTITVQNLTGSSVVNISQIGEYNVTYSLEISRAAMDFYSERHLRVNSELKKYNDFVREELLNADFYGCFTECTSCFVKLGSRSEFIDRFRELYAGQQISFSVYDSSTLSTIYDSLYLNCQELQITCATRKTPCDEKLDLLKLDVKPGGQYALLDSAGNLTDLNTNVLARRGQIQFFTDVNGIRDSVMLLDINGEDSLLVDVKNLTDQQFVRYFQDSWADSLVRLHPEYCFYQWCVANVNSYVFDRNVQELISADTAITVGLFNRNFYNAMMSSDPFFTAGAGVPFKKDMDSALARFSRMYFGYGIPDKDILEFIDLVLYCKNLSSPYDQCVVDNNCRSANREWDLYKQFYLNLKQRYYEKARLANAQYANCVNCFIGKPLLDISSIFPDEPLKPQKLFWSGPSRVVATTPTDDNGFVNIISHTTGLYGQQQYSISKLDSIGEVKWSKLYTGRLILNNLAKGTNGAIYALGEYSVDSAKVRATLNNGFPTYKRPANLPTIVKISDSGNFIWSRQIYDDTLQVRIPALGRGLAARELPGKEVLFLTTDISLSNLAINRIDSNGAFISKLVFGQNTLPGSARNFKMYVEGDTCFIAGKYEQDNYFSPDRIVFLKVNYRTGQVYWTTGLTFASIANSVLYDVAFSNGVIYASCNSFDNAGRELKGILRVARDGSMLPLLKLNDVYSRVSLGENNVGVIVASYYSNTSKELKQFNIEDNGSISNVRGYSLGRASYIDGGAIAIAQNSDVVMLLNYQKLSQNDSIKVGYFRTASNGSGAPCFLNTTNVRVQTENVLWPLGVGGFVRSDLPMVDSILPASQIMVLADTGLCSYADLSYRSDAGCVVGSRFKLDAGGYEIANDAITEDNKSSIVVGVHSDTFYDVSKGFVAKLDSTNHVIWSFSYEGNSGVRFEKIVRSIQGGYYVVGSDTLAGSRNSLIVKLDSMGGLVWSRTINYDTIFIRGTGATNVVEDENGFVYLLSNGYSSITDQRIYKYLVKMDNSGSVLFSRLLSRDGLVSRNGLQVLGNRIVVAIPYLSSTQVQSVFLAGIERSDFSTSWSKSITDPGNNVFGSALIELISKDGFIHLFQNQYEPWFHATYAAVYMKIDESGVPVNGFRIYPGNLSWVNNGWMQSATIVDNGDFLFSTRNSEIARFSSSGVRKWYRKFDFGKVTQLKKILAFDSQSYLAVGNSDLIDESNDIVFSSLDSTGYVDSCFSSLFGTPNVNAGQYTYAGAYAFSVSAVNLSTSLISLAPEIIVPIVAPICSDSCSSVSTVGSTQCSPGVYSSYGTGDLRHSVIRGRGSVRPQIIPPFGQWRFYPTFFVETAPNVSCKFSNVWVSSCERPAVFSCPTVNDFQTLLTTPLCDNGTKLGSIVRYTGTAQIPLNATITVVVNYNGSGIQWTGTFNLINGATQAYQCSPYPISASNVTTSISAVYCNIPPGDTSCIEEAFPPSYCSNNQQVENYAGKVKRFMEYVDMNQMMADVTSVDAEYGSAVIEGQKVDLCKEECEAQADYWISTLSACTNDQTKLDQLKAAFIDISSSGCVTTGAPTLSRPSNAPGLYRNFEEAIVGILGPQAISLSCTQELLSNPYPIDRQPVIEERTIIETNAAICSKLSGYTSDYQASGSSVSFYRYLLNRLGNAMTLDSLDLNDFVQSCTTCKYILKDAQTLPIAFDPVVSPLDCSRATALKLAFDQKYQGANPLSTEYELVFANFFNHALGFSLAYEDYQAFFEQCALSSNAVLYNKPMQINMFQDGDDDICLRSVFSMVLTRATLNYTVYVDSVKRDFLDAYVTKCLNVNTNVKMTANLYEYHYTLYYYDQSGSLVKTVPPAGVTLLSQADIDRVQRNRAAADLECFNAQDQVRFNNNGYFTFSSASASVKAMKPAANAFSVEAWYKFRSYTNQGVFSLHAQGAGNAYGPGYILQVRNDSLIFRVAGSATSFLEARAGRLSVLVPDTNWRHIVVQKTNSSPALRIFINGTLIPASVVNIGFTPATLVSPNATLRIGGSPIPVGSANFNGAIRQFRYYQRVLSVAEIRQNQFNNCLLPASMESLLFWSTLNDGTGVIRNYLNQDVATTTGTAPTWFSNRTVQYPAHSMATTYEYNSFNQVKKQFSPDGGTSEFWYDRLGRLVASQNEEQRLGTDTYGLGTNRFSYTKYDALGRITEVGEKTNASANPRISNSLETAQVNAFLNTGLSAQITKTIYDQALFPYQNPSTSRKRVSATTYQDTEAETDPDASYYSYDIMGNVKTMIQRSKMLVAADNSNGEKRIDYQYDLISGKVNQVIYQPGKGDQFIHRYDYDADNRIISVNTSRDGLIWQNDAKYVYHLHGPLARTELGDQKVQGLDYAYTLQGWLKGVNSSSLHEGLFDIGQDGKTGGSLPIVGRDAYGYMLDYYVGDYKPIGQQAFSLNTFTSPSPEPNTGFKSLYNGNIGGMVTNIRQLNSPQYTYYHYDQLNRIKRMEALHGQNAAANTWTFGLRFNGYIESFTYDPNGNINTLSRNSNVAQIDDLTYNYMAGTNKLTSVTDPIPSGLVNYDIDGQAVNNYSYDRIGNMTADNAEGITNISWTVYGKIKSITKSNGTIEYRYDASGNRIYKKTVISGATTETYYARDAQGNVMAVYEKQAANPLKWMEQHLYGSSRLGMWNLADMVPGTTIPASGGTVEDGYVYGSKLFELSNHLGNVLVTVSDKKIGIDDGGNGTTDYFQPEVLTAQDYYSFGMTMPGRKYTKPNSGYRYGFNGKENDNDVKGEGNQQDYGMRIYDPRLGRFLSLDPMTGQYPWYTPYQFAGNMPIWCIDIDGLEENGASTYVYKRPPSNIPKSQANNSSRGMNLGVLRLEKQSYNGTPWISFSLFQPTVQQNFAGNVMVSTWNQGLSSVEFSYNYLSSKQYRKDFDRSVAISLFKGFQWLVTTDDDEKLSNAKDYLSDVGNWEDFVGSIALAKGVNGSLTINFKNPGKFTVWTGEEAKRYLKSVGGNAAYMATEDGGTLILKSGASNPEIVEELIHHYQRMKYGLKDFTRNRTLMEIEAQDELMKYGKRNNWSKEELDKIQNAKKVWEKKLKEEQK